VCATIDESTGRIAGRYTPQEFAKDYYHDGR
jgi:hypothetical protein